MALIDGIAAFLAAACVALLAFRARALAPSGAVAATIVGGVTTAAGGWRWGALLIAFFLTASLLSRLTDRRRPEQSRFVVRGVRRDARQVVANGGIATLCAVAYALTDSRVMSAAFAASLAVAAADTWATEIGAYSRRPPRLITSFAPAPRGTSGAISPLGSAATIAGALTIALLATLLLGPELDDSIRLLLAAALGGVAGSLADSLLGATLQARYHCPACDQPTEARVHRCGTSTRQTRGLAVVTNDVVNMTAVITGAIIGTLIWVL